MSRITMVYITKKVTIYILYPIKEVYEGFIYLCIKKLGFRTYISNEI